MSEPKSAYDYMITKLEPEVSCAIPSDRVGLSQAISLRRIADALSTPAQPVAEQSAPHETEYSKCKVICDCADDVDCPQYATGEIGSRFHRAGDQRSRRCIIWIERRKLFQSKG